MNKLILILILLPVQGLSQLPTFHGLWKGGLVKDTLGNEIRYKRQDFIKIKEDTIFLFQFDELMSMETGEVTIETKVDTLIAEYKENKSIFNLKGINQNLKVSVLNDNEFEIFLPKITLTFTKMATLEKPELSLKEFKDFIIGSTFIEIDPKSMDEIDDLTKSYLENGKVLYQTIDSSSSWESAYKIEVFEEYIFLKGITSAPIILSNIEDNVIHGIEADYRYSPKNIRLKKK